jgi:excisionase family DNA binding protein
MNLLTIKQVAEYLQLSRWTVMDMINDGKIPAICLRSGKRKKLWRVRPEHLERWVTQLERKAK